MSIVRVLAGHVRFQGLMRKRVVLFPLMLLLLSHWVLGIDALAGNLSVNFGGLPPATAVVVPQNPQDKVTTDTVKTTVQTTTDIQTPTAEPLPAGSTSVGFDATISDKKKIFNIPLGYSISERTGILVNVPLAIVDVPTSSGDTERNSSIGDVSVTLKQRFGDEKEIEYQALFTTKLITGDKEKGLGTGAYDLGLTGKIIKRLDIHRFTWMGSYTHSQTNPTIGGQEVSYGDKWAWMAAYDVNIAKLLRIWLGAKLTGAVVQETTINGMPQSDKLTIVDLTPEIKYFFSENRALNFGVNIPVSTQYDVVNADRRGISVNFGFFSLF